MKEYEPRPILEQGKSLLVMTELDGKVTQDFLLLLAQKESDELVPNINVYIDSKGGDVWGAIVMAEAIRRCTKPVTTVAIGRAYSGAALITASGHKRLAWPEADFMFHSIQIKGDMNGDMEDLRKETKAMERMNDIWLSLFSKYTGQSMDKVRKDSDRDIYLTADEAREYGLIDEILNDPPVFTKGRIVGE